MKGNIYNSGDYSDKAPEWYWRAGLHDSEIISVEMLDLDYDYKLRNPIRNSFTLNLNSKSALYDTSVKSISFFNYNILTPEVKLDGCYWLQDVLNYTDGKFVLDITITNCIRESVFTIRFDSAQVKK